MHEGGPKMTSLEAIYFKSFWHRDEIWKDSLNNMLQSKPIEIYFQLLCIAVHVMKPKMVHSSAQLCCVHISRTFIVSYT